MTEPEHTYDRQMHTCMHTCTHTTV